jgi:hypothetical protein
MIEPSVSKIVLFQLTFEERKFILKLYWKTWVLRYRDLVEIKLEFDAVGGHFDHL